jgi:uncharacterized membrane protein
MRWALLISLAVNLLLVGAAVGWGIGEWRREKAQATAAVERAPNMRAVLDALPPERAAAMREEVADAWRAARKDRTEAGAARAEVARVVVAETYDRAAVGAAFARLRAADASVAARFHDAVADSMAGMTVEERRAMLGQLMARRADTARASAADMRARLRQMPAEERRALFREFAEERAKMQALTPEERRERLKAMREEWRRKRMEEAPPAASPTP